MDKYKKYYGVLIFLVVVGLVAYSVYQYVQPKLLEVDNLSQNLSKREQILQGKKKEKFNVQEKIKSLANAQATVQKKIYAPTFGSDNDTLFFSLYTDMIDLAHQNSLRIKDIKYKHNPAEDKFVQYGANKYFVCDINMSVVSNFVQLGQFIENLYQYPYYLRINSVKVRPYNKDKTILMTDLSIRLYSFTEPQAE